MPAGTTLLVGDTLHYQFKAIGFDRLQKRVSLVMRVQVLDADGKDVGAKPVEAKAEVTDPAKVADARSATLGGQAVMNRPGEFKLRITVEDTIGKKTAKYVWAQRKVTGRPTLELLAEHLPAWIEQIPFKKTMRWVPGARTGFARTKPTFWTRTSLPTGDSP